MRSGCAHPCTPCVIDGDMKEGPNPRRFSIPSRLKLRPSNCNPHRASHEQPLINPAPPSIAGPLHSAFHAIPPPTTHITSSRLSKLGECPGALGLSLASIKLLATRLGPLLSPRHNVSATHQTSAPAATPSYLSHTLTTLPATTPFLPTTTAPVCCTTSL